MKDVLNELIVSKAFSNQSSVFDTLYDTNYIVNYSRKIIREEVIRQMPAGGDMLEINAGTGTDAIYFASHGFRITATDVSPEMVKLMRNKVTALQLDHLIQVGQCSFWDLPDFNNRKYDLIYSNFGGLNCTANIEQVLDRIIDKLMPGGKAILVIMPVFCPWERVMLLAGNTRIGLRRRKGKPARAHIEGEHFNVWYYNPSDVVKAIQGKARLIRLQSLSLFVPPSAYRTFDEKYPRLLAFLEKLDAWVTRTWPFRNWGDYVILTIEK